MTEFTQLQPEGQTLIQSYGDGGFRISGRRFEGTVIVVADRVSGSDVASFDDFDPRHLDPVLGAAGEIDILLLGCGKRAGTLGSASRKRLAEAGIAVETMDTGAACRTFNILQAEGRRVAALLISVP